MITSNGSPQDYGIYSNLNFTFEECLDYCNEEERCMMIYEFGSTVCQVFEIGEVKSVKRNNDVAKRFGYKVADSKNTTCPSGDTVGGKGRSVGTNETSGRQIYQSYSIVYDPVSESFIFNASAIKMCPNIRYQMTMRESGPWCLAWSTGNVCMNHSTAVAVGSSSPPGVLSGLETPEEFEFVEMRANEMKKTGVWVAGVRKPECIGNSSCQGIQAFSFSDPFLSENPTGYLWNPNQPNGTFQ